jgi:hypothetical protein
MQTTELLSDFKLHSYMFAIAEKYTIQGLADLSAKDYKACLDLITDCPAFIRFMDSIPDVYDLIPTSVKSLRKISTKFAVKMNLNRYLADEKFRTTYKSITSAFPAFARGVIYVFVTESPRPPGCVCKIKNYICSNFGSRFP